MLDADANLLLTRADELVQAGRSDEAAALSESVAQRLASQGNVLGAAAAYQRALHLLQADFAPRERKQRISECLSGALSELGMASGVERARRIECLFRAALHYWSDPPAGGHRGVCFACARLKPASWMRCRGCGELPRLSEQVAFGLLASERACSSERLQEIARRAAAGELPIAPDVQRLFAAALYGCSAERDEFAGRPAPGTVVARVHQNQRSAVLLEVSTSSEFISDKPACTELLDDVCQALLATHDSVAVDELELPDGRAVRDVKSELLRRLGGSIRFERWRRLEVERGAVAMAVLGADVPGARDSRPHRARACGNLAVAVVALAGESSARESAPLRDFAEQLAAQVLRTNASEDDLADLPREPFAMDPSLSVAAALEVLSATLGFEVRLSGAACYRRRPAPEDDPPVFPGEAAMHG